MKWISTASLVMALACACTANQAMAQTVATAQPSDDINARLEQQGREIEALRAQVAGMQQGVNATPAAYATTSGTAADPAPAAAAGAEVGSDMSIKARFYNGAGLMFETPNKDFTMHLGGWAQWDNVWWNQSNGMNTAATAQLSAGTAANSGHQGLASGGIGQLEDGDYFRRLRIVMEGNFWETFEYRWNWALENNQFSQVGLDEFWIADNKLPLIGTIRVGHVKTPMGFEGDMTSSSRTMTFMERSSYSQAIEMDQNFCTGIWFGNTYDDQHGTWSLAAFRPDTINNGNSGDFFGTGQWGIQGRVTALPIYEDEGRHLLHLGLSGGWRDGVNSATTGSSSVNVADLRSRPELRDDNAAGSPSGGQALNDANSTRMIDTGKIAVTSEYLLGTELCYIRGPWSLQAEYGWNFIYGQTTINQTSATAGLGPLTYYAFDGGYLQAAYTLTGENRAYDRQMGTLSRYYFGSQGPYENAFLVRDLDGGICSGHGAWEIACRYSYTDLNAGPAGLAHIQGGIMNGLSLALNWYLNTNLTVNTEWVYNNRFDLPNAANNTGATAQVGSTGGFGTRVQLSF